MLGYAYQLGQIPIGHDAIEEAIALNGAAVEMNRQAFRFGRLAAHDISALDRIITRETKDAAASGPQTLDDIVDHRANLLAAYQDDALAQRYRAKIDWIASLEKANAAGLSGLSEAVARGYYKLLAYKDEYEVARLYADPAFEAALKDAFEGDLKLEFHLAPPLLARKDKATGHPRKMHFGRWMLPAFRLLAKGKRFRGTRWDIFGHTDERKLERQMIADYERLLDEIEKHLSPAAHAVALELAALPTTIRGFGHVKQANYDAARARESELLKQLRSPSPERSRQAA